MSGMRSGGLWDELGRVFACILFISDDLSNGRSFSNVFLWCACVPTEFDVI